MFDNWDAVHKDIKQIVYMQGGKILLEKVDASGKVYDSTIIKQADVAITLPELPAGTVLTRPAVIN